MPYFGFQHQRTTNHRQFFQGYATVNRVFMPVAYSSRLDLSYCTADFATANRYTGPIHRPGDSAATRHVLGRIEVTMQLQDIIRGTPEITNVFRQWLNVVSDEDLAEFIPSEIVLGKDFVATHRVIEYPGHIGGSLSVTLDMTHVGCYTPPLPTPSP